MRTQPLRASLPLVLACLLAVLLFFLAIAGAGSHLWGLYLLPILVAFLWGRRRDIYIVTALTSVLVIAEYWTNGADLGDLLINHLLPILILWGAAWLLARRYAELRASAERFQQGGYLGYSMYEEAEEPTFFYVDPEKTGEDSDWWR